MQIKTISQNIKPAFGAKIRINSPELTYMFAKELSNNGNFTKNKLKENIETFKKLYPEQTIEFKLRDDNYSDAQLDVFNPQTMHIKSFKAIDRNGIVSDTFNKVFEFLTGAKDFWTDKTAKDLFVK